MRYLPHTPHLFLLLAVLESCLAFMAGDNTHTISLHDYYIVIPQAHVRWVIALLALLFAAAYALTERSGRAIGVPLGKVHLALTLLGLLLPTMAMFKPEPLSDESWIITAMVGMLMFFAGLLVFLFGLFMALFRSRCVARGTQTGRS
jgi:hypothetical protein